MNVARILYPVTVLGPGKRIGIWVAGCHQACKGCSNPELWEQKPEYDISINDVLKLVRRIADAHSVDGFTISGGEPFNQAEELAALLTELSFISSDIIIYTGYTIEELRQADSESIKNVLSHTAVIVDGPYIEELNDNTVLRGSSNQGIHIVNPNYEKKYCDYLANLSNQIQNFTTTDGVVSVGIHRKTF